MCVKKMIMIIIYSLQYIWDCVSMLYRLYSGLMHRYSSDYLGKVPLS